MKIYGVALLAGCFIVGQIIGELLGRVMNINGNIGGVGFAMLLLMVVEDRLRKEQKFNDPMEKGIAFWNAMYIPVVVAMSATQNVKLALKGGWLALIVGLSVTFLGLLMVPLVSRIRYTNETR